MNDTDIEALRAWIGRGETAQEMLSPVPARCLAAALSLPPQAHPAETLPPLWHWLHFPDTTPSSMLGVDGAPRDQTLMPPVPLDQVMWAGAEFEFLHPLRIGVETRRQSTLTDMVFKEGSRGVMVFVTWEHRFEQDDRLALVERSRGVFLNANHGRTSAGPGPGPRGRRDAARRAEWLMNEAVLFRYSALTFNAHRIHYDHRYATEVGKYPGLVVHGPLQATLLAESFRAWYPRHIVQRAEFRARAPLFLGSPVTVNAAEPDGDSFVMWTCAPDGAPAMDCVITARPASTPAADPLLQPVREP